MLRLLFGILLGGLVVSCAMEESEPSGTLSIDPNYGEAPKGVTIQDVDHVKDGVIDIKDLSAVAYFHGQKVPDSSSDSSVEQTDSKFDFLVGDQQTSFTVEVDKVFTVSFKTKGSTSSRVGRAPIAEIEAQDSNGNVLDNVLAGAKTLDYNKGSVFSLYNSFVFSFSRSATEFQVFFVPEAISRGVAKLVGYADGDKAGEVNITIRTSSRTMTAERTGNQTRYLLTPVPDNNHQKGDSRQLHVILKKLNGDGDVTSDNLDTKNDQHTYGVSTYSDNRSDSYYITVDNNRLPCVAPNSIYAWLQEETTGEEVRLERRRLYRVDCP